MARKRSTDDPKLVWKWPPLEPGETPETRKQRIQEAFMPLVRELARMQAEMDHAAGITRTEEETIALFASEGYLHRMLGCTPRPPERGRAKP